MGMVDAFIPGTADFSGLSDVAREVGLFVSKVKQKSFVEVNEEGTEAAAATIVDIRLTAASEDFNFRANRPFIFFIRERLTNTILFAGAYMTPPED
jgi:serpin B